MLLQVLPRRKNGEQNYNNSSNSRSNDYELTASKTPRDGYVNEVYDSEKKPIPSSGHSNETTVEHHKTFGYSDIQTPEKETAIQSRNTKDEFDGGRVNISADDNEDDALKDHVTIEIEKPVDNIFNMNHSEQHAAPLEYLDNALERHDKSDSDSDSDSDEDNDNNLDLSLLGKRQSDVSAMEKEYKSLENRMPTELIYPSGVKKKNRKPNEYPWPDKRVTLSSLPHDDESDYINASYMKGSVGGVNAIATQAPMTSTIDDFWRMIWEQNVKIIVMATPLTIHGQERCAQYWPTDSVSKHYSNITVSLKNKDLKPDFIITTLDVSDESSNREVVLFRYMRWQSDGEIPESTKSVVAFLLEVKDAIVKHNNPTPVFHGTNALGVGAMFLAILQGVIQYDRQRHVNTQQLIRKLRKNLAGAIDSFEQYKFIYQSLYVYGQYAADM